MSNFHDYARYYDAFYADKDYKNETLYVKSLIDKHINDPMTLLDLGCGTGKHAALMAGYGLEVMGVDRSVEMLKYAEERKQGLPDETGRRLVYQAGDIRDINPGKKFDVVTALFHVMSYQVTDTDINSVLACVHHNLRKDGIFIFDYWYGPCVINEKPVEKSREFISDKTRIRRTVIPELNLDTHTVVMKVNLEVTDPDLNSRENIDEIHTMRFFFDNELKAFMSKHGFEILGTYEWMTNSQPGEHSWSAVTVAKKN